MWPLCLKGWVLACLWAETRQRYGSVLLSSDCSCWYSSTGSSCSLQVPGWMNMLIWLLESPSGLQALYLILLSSVSPPPALSVPDWPTHRVHSLCQWYVHGHMGGGEIIEETNVKNMPGTYFFLNIKKKETRTIVYLKKKPVRFLYTFWHHFNVLIYIYIYKKSD